MSVQGKQKCVFSKHQIQEVYFKHSTKQATEVATRHYSNKFIVPNVILINMSNV